MASTINHIPEPKALPPVNKGDHLPPPPSSPPSRPTGAPPPIPPPKSSFHGGHPDSPSGSPSLDDRLLQQSPNELLSPPSIATLPPDSPSFSPGQNPMLGPPSPGLPPVNGSRPKKVNPFVDLMETEKIYVDTLSGIIRKVAAAWSRSNLPPPELDMMFRSIEAIYKANRSFQAKLKEIGPNPSSPRAVGDLLMKWIDQLDSPYTKYASAYLYGFDTWEPVRGNQRLPPIIEGFSASNPPPQAPLWSLDALFSLPRARIKYYQKLYGRLLKSSPPGKSTDQKLVDGVGRLENLLAVIDERLNIALPGPTQSVETTDVIVIDTRKNVDDPSRPSPNDADVVNQIRNETTLRPHEGLDMRSSVESSARSSSLSSGLRSSRDTSVTSEGRASVTTLSMSLADLERRLATKRCQDLFTMTPRNVKLSINSPNLSYTRELRLSEDTTIYFTPKSTGIEVVHRQGHIFVLTDLFLVCERMFPDDRARYNSQGADIWLCYPPLAVKHVRVAELEDTAMEVTILKKEVMRLYFDSKAKRDSVIGDFKATIDLAAALPPPSNKPPPPLPSMGNTSSIPGSSARRPSDPPSEHWSSSRSANVSRAASPSSGDASMHRVDPGRNSLNDAGSVTQSPICREGGPPPYSPTNEQGRPPQMASPPVLRPVDGPSIAPGQFIPPPRGESSRGGGGMPPRSAGPMGLPPQPNMRDGPLPGPTSFSPGQIMPPHRSGSIQAQPPMGGRPPQGGPVSPPPMHGMQGPSRNIMSPPPMNGMQGPPRNMMSPPMNGGPQHMGYGNGPMAAPRPVMGGPGPGAIFQDGPGSMHGPQGFGPGPNHLPPHPGQPFAAPGRPASDPNYQAGLRKTPSLHSLSSQHEHFQQGPRSAPPVPNIPNDFLSERQNSFGTIGPGQSHLRPMLPSVAVPRIASSAPAFGLDESPPTSPTVPKGPVESVVLASMKCKIFLQQQHAQWKALGSSKLTLYQQRPTMLKQLVVEADNRDKTILISTIVLTDGVERVGKTGVAIELSDNGARTGIVYMIQLRNEKSAGGLYENLLSGSDRRV
ncbi:hypothetical protein A7U60_g7345 [Sanghuangporus baumii]|uniref:DH domain-containing protein n=1 Tax=Sanghuangporus baumii TaxID=108892 RepID=A0A9Q5HTQ8_SANBA|nr:hypothetical protein A7U60_g7345 [Sanghuangporus baumii]